MLQMSIGGVWLIKVELELKLALLSSLNVTVLQLHSCNIGGALNKHPINELEQINVRYDYNRLKRKQTNKLQNSSNGDESIGLDWIAYHMILCEIK